MSKSPEKRAEEIIGRWRPYMKVFGPSKGFPENEGSMQKDIATQIREAVSDESRKDFLEFMELCRNSLALEAIARRKAFEEAAKIAEELECDQDTGRPMDRIAQAIRVKAAEVSK